METRDFLREAGPPGLKLLGSHNNNSVVGAAMDAAWHVVSGVDEGVAGVSKVLRGGKRVVVELVASTALAAEELLARAFDRAAPAGGEQVESVMVAGFDRDWRAALEHSAAAAGWRPAWVEPCTLWVGDGVGANADESKGVGGTTGGSVPSPSLLDGRARVVRLAPAHAAQVNQRWKYRSEGSLAKVGAMIGAGRSQPCFGVEVRASDGAEETGGGGGGGGGWVLASWCLTYDDGALGMMGTLEQHRRRGLARACVAAVVRELRETGRSPF
eukprot:g6138.t1